MSQSTKKLGSIQVLCQEVGGWGQKMGIFDDLQYCKSSKRWVGLKKAKTWWCNTWKSLRILLGYFLQFDFQYLFLTLVNKITYLRLVDKIIILSSVVELEFSP